MLALFGVHKKTITTVGCLSQYPYFLATFVRVHVCIEICPNMCCSSTNEQMVPPPLMSYNDRDDKRLHFVDHLVTGVTLASHESTCAIEYMQWFKVVSSPYIVCCVEKDRSIVIPCRHACSPYDGDIYPHHIKIMNLHQDIMLFNICIIYYLLRTSF